MGFVYYLWFLAGLTFVLLGFAIDLVWRTGGAPWEVDYMACVVAAHAIFLAVSGWKWRTVEKRFPAPR